ncbi:glycosyltransferase family 2 protein [Calothrix rhizosoleniae]|uniref:glycosyltransferase family 2 protein n=1 Tax=Calothrix rhizosoleniae TaxID=888997 RepID=UPI000B49BF4B|nr:glycosyltransferase family 2 protein [Calothrix rhizosoleniae]
MKESIYIIIPVHNRKQITLFCLENLQKIGDLDRYHIVIIDDGSTDGTAEAIHSQYPEATVLEGNGDLWWTGAMAVGMQYACEQGAEYLFWLNDDCIPATNTISGLVKFMRNHPDTIVAPACEVKNGNSFTRITNGAKGRKGLLAQPGEIVSVDGMSGRCVGIPSKVIQKIGLPDAVKFPHYSGDHMYVLKATRSGFKAYLVGDFTTAMYGEVYETLNLHKYFRPESTPVTTFKALFFNKKSPYRLPTQFLYLTEKYGYLEGIFLFILKFISWSWLWLGFQFGLSMKQIFGREGI